MELRLLGPVEAIADGGAVVDIGVPQRRAVFAALAADAGRLVTRDVLIDRVWDQAPPNSVQAAVYSHVTRIRHLLHRLTSAVGDRAPAHLVRQPGGYVLLVEPDLVDLHRFRRLVTAAGHAGSDEQRAGLLRHAVTLWRGEPLAGLPGGWAARTRQNWTAQRLDAVVAWARAELALGNPGAVITPLTDLAGEHPLHESLAAALMRALSRAGRFSHALECYLSIRRRLAEELGTDPSRELQALHAAVLRGDLDAPAVTTSAPVGPLTTARLRTTRPTTQEAGPAKQEANPAKRVADPAKREVGPAKREVGPARWVAGPAAGAAERAAAATRRAVSLSAPPKAERTLPADVGGFVGRRDELRRLLAAVTGADDGRARPATIHAIDGMAGVGKTAFAIHAAHRLADRFPDGQRFVALRSHVPGHPPVDPAAALETLLQADGVAAAQIPASLDARAGLWRDRLSGRRLLLVLDDAADPAHVAPLLPADAGCAVLITSRRKLTTLPNAVMLSLGTLPKRHSADLFTARAGRGCDDPDAIELITALCDGLPLAIALTAARLHTHPSWTVTDLANDLAAAHDRLGELASGDLAVAAAFDLSYRHLPASRQRLFRRLGLHPGPDIDVHAVAALDHSGLAAARRGLEDLLEHNLITEPHRGRYRLHDLIAAHAHALAANDPPAERDAARDRLLGFYLRTAVLAAGYLARKTPAGNRPGEAVPGDRPGEAMPSDRPGEAVPGDRPGEVPTADRPGEPVSGDPPVVELTGLEQATDWLAREQPNLVACAGHAADHHRTAVAMGIPAALHEHLRARGPWSLALDLHRTALAAAHRAGDLPGQAAALANLADTQRLAGYHVEAATTLGQALELYRRLGDRHGQANALHTLGHVQYLTDDHVTAVASLRSALDLSTQLGDRHAQANALHILGIVQHTTCDYRAAAGSARASLELYRQLGDRYGQANALLALGIVQYTTGDYRAAATSGRQTLGLSSELGNRLGEANALQILGRVQHATGDLAAAAAAADRALRLCRQIGNRFGQANALDLLGRVQHAAGDHRAASGSARAALDLYRQLDSRQGQATALITLGRVQQATGDQAAATDTLGQALELLRAVGQRGGEAETLNHLGDLLLACATPAAAQRRFACALGIARAIGTPPHEARALEGLGSCALRSGRPEEGIAHLRQALAIYQRIASAHAGRVAATLRYALGPDSGSDPDSAAGA